MKLFIFRCRFVAAGVDLIGYFGVVCVESVSPLWQQLVFCGVFCISSGFVPI